MELGGVGSMLLLLPLRTDRPKTAAKVLDPVKEPPPSSRVVGMSTEADLPVKAARMFLSVKEAISRDSRLDRLNRFSLVK